MRGVDVAAHDHALAALAEALGEPEEVVVELELVGQALGPHPSVGKVHVEEMELRQLGVDDPSLDVQRGGAEGRRRHVHRLVLQVGDDAAIALLLGEAPVRAVALGRAHLLGELVRLELGLLHADRVRPAGSKEIHEALLPRGA
jgi:hypothetical protein